MKSSKKIKILKRNIKSILQKICKIPKFSEKEKYATGKNFNFLND